MCTNVRGMDGKQPTFIDHTESTFFFPYLVIRFLEIPAGAMARHRPTVAAWTSPAWPRAGPATMSSPGKPPPGARAAGDEDFDDSSADGDLEIDEDFLQRIRDI